MTIGNIPNPICKFRWQERGKGNPGVRRNQAAGRGAGRKSLVSEKRKGPHLFILSCRGGCTKKEQMGIRSGGKGSVPRRGEYIGGRENIHGRKKI